MTHVGRWDPDQEPLFESSNSLFEINPSRLSTYQHCPRKYKFRYVDGRPERSSSSAAALGRSMHRALCDFYARPQLERTRDSLFECLRHAWDPAGHETVASARKDYLKAQDMLAKFYETSDHGAIRVFALESKFITRRDGLLVWGRVDRLDRQDDGYVVVDYKTGRSPSKGEDWHGLSMALYAAAVGGQLNSDVTRFEVHYLAEGRIVTVEHEDQWSDVLEVGLTMRDDEEFQPSPSSACSWCDFLDVCPQGAAAIGHVRSVRRRWQTKY